MKATIYTSKMNLLTVSVRNPHRELTDSEAKHLVGSLFTRSTEVLAINQAENLVLIKNASGVLKTYKYCTSHICQATPTHYEQKLEHYLLGETHHTMRDFQTLFSQHPVGLLKRFTSETELVHVNVTRVGKRRKMIDEVGNIFVKALNKYFKFPEQVEY